MNTNPPIRDEPDHENEGPFAGLTLFIDTPLDITVAICLAAPLRHIFVTALADNLIAPPSVAPGINGLYMCFRLREAAPGIETIHRELQALGYLGLAHLGQWQPDGLHCLHGSADKVLAFEEMAEAAQTDIQFSTEVLSAHVAAFSKPPPMK